MSGWLRVSCVNFKVSNCVERRCFSNWNCDYSRVASRSRLSFATASSAAAIAFVRALSSHFETSRQVKELKTDPFLVLIWNVMFSSTTPLVHLNLNKLIYSFKTMVIYCPSFSIAVLSCYILIFEIDLLFWKTIITQNHRFQSGMNAFLLF